MTLIEAAITGKMIEALLDAGYHVAVEDIGHERWLYATMNKNRPRGGYRYWVKLVPGNGANLISDYTVNLESIVDPIIKWGEAFGD